MNLNNEPKISIITISYNSAAYIEETIKSVIAQNYMNKEYIIIDGGSTDGTMDIIDKFRLKIDVVVHEPDTGISNAFNKGIGRSTGDVIGIVNSGDIMIPGTLESLAKQYEEGIDLYRGKEIIRNYETGKEFILNPSFRYPRLSFPFNCCHMGTFITKKAFEKYGLYDEKFVIGMDKELLFRFHRLGAKEKRLDGLFGLFRRGGISQNPAYDDKKIEETVSIIKDNGGGKLDTFIIILYLKFRFCIRDVVGKKKNQSKYAIIWPSFQEGNKYIDIHRGVADSLGYHLIRLRDIVKPRFWFRRIEWVHFNWYENLYADNRLKACLIVMERKIIILFLKKMKKTKIIMTVHNKYEHNAFFPDYSKYLMLWLLRQADEVIALCKETITYLEEFTFKTGIADVREKCVQAFHPNYIGAYIHQSDTVFKIQRKVNEMVLLYFGSISEYKNVDMLIMLAEAVQEQNIKIIIAGAADEAFLNKAFSESEKLKNLIIIPKYIPDEEIWELIEQADCVVLPYNIDSVLNSGACMLALSVGKNVICPAFGTIKDFPDGLAYTYTYSGQEQHLQLLYNKVMEAYDDYINRYNLFIARCEELHRIVEYDYSVDKLRDIYKQLYEGKQQV